MKDYRITIKIRNNRILKAIENSGGSPGHKWCDANGLSYQAVNDLINMTASPRNLITGELSTAAEKLCDALGLLPDELWSSEQLYPLASNTGEVELDYSGVFAMLPQSYELDTSRLEQDQARKLIGKALATLTAREREIIKMRFEGDMSLLDCAKVHDVTSSRIRQIEQKAIRKLRNPVLLGVMADAYVDTDTADDRKWRRECANGYADKYGVLPK